MSTQTKNAPAGAANTAGAENATSHLAKGSLAIMMSFLDQTCQCRPSGPATTAPQHLNTATAFDRLLNLIELARSDGTELFDQLPADAPPFGCGDLATAICHLKRAATALDRAAQQLDHTVVTR